MAATQSQQTEMTLPSNETTQTTPTRGQMGGAAILGGVTALALGGGPLVALVAAGGMVATATNKGTTGEVVRFGGEVVTSTGKQIKNFNKKHRLVEKTTNGVVKRVPRVVDKVLETDLVGVAVTTTVFSAACVCAIAEVASGGKKEAEVPPSNSQ